MLEFAIFIIVMIVVSVVGKVKKESSGAGKHPNARVQKLIEQVQGQYVGQPTCEEGRGRVGDDDPPAYLRGAQVGQRNPAEGHVRVVRLRAHAEPVRQRGGGRRLLGDDGSESARLDVHPGPGVGEHRPHGWGGCR